MRKISKIEPTVPTISLKKKTAAYARVSMETERLNHSLSAQISYYSELIQKNPEWEYAGVYADSFVSGTEIDKRKEFKRMLEDCENGKIDIILTKSISRFARNTVDLLQTVRHLKELGIEVRFEKERINSMSGDGELMLSILASFAQEESRSISENVKWGIRKRMKQGVPNGHFRVLGYRWENDNLVIVPEEAAIVRRIFQNFLDDKSRLETERELEAEGIRSINGCVMRDSNIKTILTNITYTGNLLLQKEFISDPISKHRRKNHGELPQYYVENTHEAIIDKETFDYVQSEMERRKELGALANKSLNICCFTGKIKCPYCGVSYMHNKRTKNGCFQEYWNCGSKKKKKVGDGCPVGGTINHKNLIKACTEVLELTAFDEKIFLEKIDHIEVPQRYTLEFFFKDGGRVTKPCPNTGHKDCWTAEYKARVSAYRKKYGTNPKGATCFTSKVKCSECGNNYRRQTKTRGNGEKYAVYACATTNTCDNNCIHEDELKRLSAEAMGLESFSSEIFKERIDHVSIAKGGNVTFHFKNGTMSNAVYSTKRKMPPWTEERRIAQTQAIRNSFTEERRHEMSERMKQIRKERGNQWRKK